MLKKTQDVSAMVKHVRLACLHRKTRELEWKNAFCVNGPLKSAAWDFDFWSVDVEIADSFRVYIILYITLSVEELPSL